MQFFDIFNAIADLTLLVIYCLYIFILRRSLTKKSAENQQFYEGDPYLPWYINCYGGNLLGKNDNTRDHGRRWCQCFDLWLFKLIIWKAWNFHWLTKTLSDCGDNSVVLIKDSNMLFSPFWACDRYVSCIQFIDSLVPIWQGQYYRVIAG